jgi:glycosyltransferase involved in cell wall biosynthesis
MNNSIQRKTAAIDVVLPLRSPAPWLDETLAGLQQQDFTDWRLICTIHEDSLELTDKILRCFQDATIIPVSDDLNFPAVLNIGVRSGTAKYVARIDQDDIPLPDRLSKQFDYLEENPDVAVVATPVTLIDSTGQFLGTSFRISSQDIERRLMIKNCIAHPSIMMRRSIFTSIGGYEVTALNGEDYELWLRIASVARIACLQEPLLKYRRHAGQMSSVGVMGSEARSAVRRARIELAGAGALNRARVEVSHAMWTIPQLWRGWRRSRSSSHA